MMDISDPLPAPSVIGENRALFRSFIVSAHAVASLVLEVLDEYLGLPPGTLPSLHRMEGVSGDQVRMIKIQPEQSQTRDDRQKTLGEHTDFGSVTVLFNHFIGGLQILPPGKDAEWCYVKPLPGHAIVNLGDALVLFTHGLLRSNIHRVVSPPGAQADFTRYSLVYFSRPEDDVVLKRLPGSDMIPPLATGEEEQRVKSKDWILRRALARRIAMHGERAFDWDRAKGTEEQSSRPSQRAYL